MSILISHLDVLDLLLPQPAPLLDVPPGSLHEAPDVDGPAHQGVSGIAHVLGEGEAPLKCIRIGENRRC